MFFRGEKLLLNVECYVGMWLLWTVRYVTQLHSLNRIQSHAQHSTMQQTSQHSLAFCIAKNFWVTQNVYCGWDLHWWHPDEKTVFTGLVDLKVVQLVCPSKKWIWRKLPCPKIPQILVGGVRHIGMGSSFSLTNYLRQWRPIYNVTQCQFIQVTIKVKSTKKLYTGE